MARIQVEPGLFVHCEVTDYLWPWDVTTPVVMMHGFARNEAVWTRWVPTLATTRRVYRPDLRGCGSSDKPPGLRFSKEILIRDLMTVLDDLDLERVHWIGEAMGGFLGTFIAAAHPERIASLVLCNTPLHVVASNKKAKSVGEPGLAEAILKYGTEEWSRRTMGNRLDPAWATPELRDWYIAQQARTPAHVAAGIYNDFEEHVDIEPVLPAVRAPVLLLCGDRDPAAIPEQQEILRTKLPHAKHRIFSGYAHGINLLLPEECARAAAAFIAEIDAAEG